MKINYLQFPNDYKEMTRSLDFFFFFFFNEWLLRDQAQLNKEDLTAHVTGR